MYCTRREGGLEFLRDEAAIFKDIKERKGCGVHQTNQERFRAALRFARVPQEEIRLNAR